MRFTRYVNAQAKVYYVAFTLMALPVGVLTSYLFGVVTYWGLGGAIGLTVFALLALYGILSLAIFTRVDIGPGTVVLASPFWRTSVARSEVERVTLDPPVHDPSLDWSWSKTQSLMTIHRRAKRPLFFHAMPDGLKLRIAQALDPNGHPASEV